MVRKTKEDSEKTRLLLLEKAAEVFYQKGVAHTTLNDIAKAAGMSRGAIYWRYENKADLFAAFIDEAIYPTEEAVKRLIETPELGPLEKLRQLMVLALRIPAEDKSIQRAYAVVAHHCEFVEEIGQGLARIEAREAEFLAKICRLIEQAREQKLIKNPMSDEALAFSVYAYIDGVLNVWSFDLENPAIDLAGEAENLVDTFLLGLKGRP